MNKRKMTVIAVLAAVVLTSAIFIIFFISSAAGGNPKPIILPPEQSEGQTGDVGGVFNPDASVDNINPISINRENVSQIIQNLERPISYSAKYNISLYWDGGNTSFQREIYKSGDIKKIIRYNANGIPYENYLTYKQTTCIWDEGSKNYISLNSGDIDVDDDLQIPTYEDILSLSAGEILSASYLDFGSVACIYAEAALEGTDNLRKYWVSMESGLLLKAETYSNGALIYSGEMTLFDTNTPDQLVFILPDGSYPDGLG